MRLLNGLVILLALGITPLGAQSAAPGSAQELWQDFVDLGAGFDPSLAELYADSAVIRNTRRYPDGRTRTLEMSGKEYKALVRQAMPLARSRGDIDIYSNVQFKSLGNRTRITATRYSTLKKYEAPHELIVGDSDGWKILAESGESRP
jgi:hypothetical protein